jgi:hypothetical protein
MTEQEEGTMAGHLLVAADRYGMHRLKLICGETLSEHIGLDTDATILAPLAESTDDMMPEANDGLHFCTLQTLPRLTWWCHSAMDLIEHAIGNNCPAVLKALWDVWFEDDPIQDDLALSLWGFFLEWFASLQLSVETKILSTYTRQLDKKGLRLINPSHSWW